MDPRVFILILNWKRPKETIECIESLMKLKYTNYEIVILDNASNDNSVETIKASFPDLKMIENHHNLGFGEGNNVGIRYALKNGANYVLILNNDTIVDESLLNVLVEVVEHNKNIGMVGPKILNYRQPEKVWYAGAFIDWDTGESPHLGLDENDHGQFSGNIEVERLTGCAMLVQREIFEKVGLFDPDYFLYYEDVDLCVRTKRAGYNIVCARDAKVWHKVSSSTKANQMSNIHIYYHTRNRLLFLKKHSQICQGQHEINYKFCKEYISNLFLRPLARRYRKQNGPRFWALLDFYRGQYGFKPKYHSLGNER